MQLTTDGILDLMGCKVSGFGDMNMLELVGIFFFLPIIGFCFFLIFVPPF